LAVREDRLVGTTTDVGNGTITLAATAKSKFFMPTVAVDDQLLGYAMVHDNPSINEVEVGKAPYDQTTRQLLRAHASAFVTRSTNGGARVSFSAGTKTVSFGLLAMDIDARLATEDAATFDPTDVQLSGASKLYNAYTSSGAETVAINATRETGIEVAVPWNANGQTLTWPSNCVDQQGNAPLSTWTGSRMVIFRWHPDHGGSGVHRAVVVIGGAATGLAEVADDPTPELQPLAADLDVGGFDIINYGVKKVTDVNGPLTTAAHGGRLCVLNGNVTVPVTGTFSALLYNPTATPRIVTPASGSVVHDLQTQATISIPQWGKVSVLADGTNLLADGQIA